MLTVGSVFSGCGLLDLGLHLAGLRTVWQCESDPFRRGLLAQRFGVPCFDDIHQVNGDCCGPVDVVAGGFPCRGASQAGRRQGFGHPETALWREMRRVVRDLAPAYVVVENVSNILVLRPPGGRRGDVWGEVVGDLAALGFDLWWDCFPAAAFGAPHLRDRVFCVAAHPGRQAQRGDRAGFPGGWARADVGAGGEAAPDAGHGGRRRDAVRPQCLQGGRDQASGRPHMGAEAAPEVQWGEYGPAVRRWERVLGRPAPAPLTGVRRVDARRSRGLDRPRLSALGDGVQVQAGTWIGELLVTLDAERHAA